MVLTQEDCEAVARGEEYTPTDRALLDAGAHPYLLVARPTSEP